MSPTKAPRVGGRSSRVVRIALAQINPTVGDLRGNFEKIVQSYERLNAAGAELVAHQHGLVRPRTLGKNCSASSFPSEARHAVQLR